jgi:hypothetical protein
MALLLFVILWNNTSLLAFTPLEYEKARKYDIPVFDTCDSLLYVSRIWKKFTYDEEFITKWGSPGSGDGQFRTPYAVGANSSDNVYVADFLNHRIQKFTKDGEFKIPRGIAVDSSDNIYVVDVNLQ